MKKNKAKKEVIEVVNVAPEVIEMDPLMDENLGETLEEWIEEKELSHNEARHLKKHGENPSITYAELSKRTARKVTINRMDTEVCTKIGVYCVAHLVHLPIHQSDTESLEEYENEVVLNSKNPYELAKLWLKYLPDAGEINGAADVINEFVAGIRKQDFERWGEPNNSSYVKGWFSQNVLPLDVMVDAINGMQRGPEITIEDVIDFVSTYKPSKYLNYFDAKLKTIEDAFKSVCGFGIKEYYAKHLVKCCEPMAYSVDEIEVPF